MAVSRFRTLVIRARPQGRVSSLEWPLGEPGELLDYSVDVSHLLRDAEDDAVATAELAIAPSGAGECQIDDLEVASGIVTALLTGGPPGRVYSARLKVITLGGRKFEFLIRRPIDLKQVHWSCPPPTPASIAFGVPAIWPPYYSGLALDGVAVTVVNTAGWPTSAAGLGSGAVWLNGSVVNAVLPVGPALGQPLFARLLRSVDLLARGASGLPQFDPQVAGQLWLNGVVVQASLGSFTGLAANGSVATVVNAQGWPTSPEGLPAGAVWLNGSAGFVNAVPGAVYSGIAPVFTGFLTSTELLAYGASILPTADPCRAGQYWLNGSLVVISTTNRRSD